MKDTDLLRLPEREIGTDDRARKYFYDILTTASLVESTFRTLPATKFKLNLKLLQLMHTYLKNKIMRLL